MSVPTRVDTCDRCYYYAAGSCRRNAPAIVSIGPQAHGRAWPPVRTDDWCGEWRNDFDRELQRMRDLSDLL